MSGSYGAGIDFPSRGMCFVQTGCFQVGLGAYSGVGLSGSGYVSSGLLESGVYENWGFFGNVGIGPSAGGSIMFGGGAFGGVRSFLGVGKGGSVGLQFCKVTVEC